MKVLMVSNVYTHPSDMGNRQRIYRECCQMKKLGWEIDFLYYGGKIGVYVDEMKMFFGKGHFYYANKTNIAPIYQLKSIVRNYLDKKRLSRYISLYYNADEWFYKELDDKIETLLQKEKYDAVWLQYSYQSRILKNVDKNILTIIDTHDIFAYRNRMFQKKGRIPEGFYMTKRQEKVSLSRADLIVAIQSEEEKYFQKLMKSSPTRCITLGDMVEFYKSNSGEDMVFGFIGAENDANVVGVQWMGKEVLPIIYKMEPESKCVIAGGICNLIEDNKYYTKLGKVRTLQEYYDLISVAINPIQNGTGLNIKGIEALSYGKPLVSTVIGAKGLSDAAGAMQVCEDAEQFARQVVILLKDRQKRLSMCRQAEKFIYMYNEKNRNTLLKIEEMAIEKSKR